MRNVEKPRAPLHAFPATLPHRLFQRVFSSAMFFILQHDVSPFYLHEDISHWKSIFSVDSFTNIFSP